jgi:hypothetical protein
VVLFIYLFVNIKPPRHRFGFSLAWGWQNQVGTKMREKNVGRGTNYLPQIPHGMNIEE